MVGVVFMCLISVCLMLALRITFDCWLYGSAALLIMYVDMFNHAIGMAVLADLFGPN